MSFIELLKIILKSSNKVLQHKQGNVPEFVPLECTVRVHAWNFLRSYSLIAALTEVKACHRDHAH